jgi:hypothetical protein
MAYNPRSSSGEIISHAKWKMLKAIDEVKEENIKLTPIPQVVQPLGTVRKYYIEFFKLGTADVISKTFHTAKLKHILRIIVDSGYIVRFLKFKNQVIWDKR